jgi:uncharacterized protein
VARLEAEGRFIAPIWRRSLLARAKAFALLLCATCVPVQAASVPAGIPAQSVVRATPALWEIRDADTTIYLFGTFHALDNQTSWFNRSVRAAFDASDELVLETLVPDDPAELHAIIARHSMAKQPKAGEPVYADRGAPSFVASAGQAMSAGREMGMSVEQGADAVLRRAATSSGKPVAGLESFEFQLRMFGSLPPPPKASPRSAGNLGGVLTDMQSAWRRGDNAAFAAVLGNVRSSSPQAFRTLFSSRNANWAGWIADRMAKPGTVFVAVGTGHLVGPESVQDQLAARGIASARIS